MTKQFILFSISILIFSCNTDVFEEEAELYEEVPAFTTRTSPATPFDEFEWCFLANGDSIKTPWASSCPTSIPLEVRMDVKESDGWCILYSNFNIKGYNHSYEFSNPASYLILYNKKSGMLKGFYFANNSDPNNTAFWLLTLSGANPTLFNFAREFAEANDITDNSQITLSNISTNGLVGGFDFGWNCFELELTYDPNSILEHLNISGFSLNESTYEFHGAYQSTSGGTIVTSSTNLGTVIPSIISGLTGALGETGKSWIRNNTASSDSASSSKPIKSNIASNILQAIFSSGVSALSQYGLSKVFNSFISFGSNTVQTLNFSTHGSVTITGNSSQPATGLVAPIDFQLNSLGENLGLWNLTYSPTIEIRSRPQLFDMEYVPYRGYDYFYKATMTPVINITYNPAATGGKSYSFYFTEYDNPGVVYSSTGIAYNVVDKPGYSRTTIYSDSSKVIKTMPQNYIFVINGCRPNYTSQNNKPVYDFHGTEGLATKVYLKIIASFNNQGAEIRSVKTFSPTISYNIQSGDRPYNWSITELENLGY